MRKNQVLLIRDSCKHAMNSLQGETTTEESVPEESTPLLRTPSSNIDQNLERGNLDGTPISLK